MVSQQPSREGFSLDQYGSFPEFLVHRELVHRGLQPSVDFIYQQPVLGGNSLGGYVLDFYFYNPPNLAINVQGIYFHYELDGSEGIATDRLLRAQMAGQGTTLIFIDEDHIYADVGYYVGEALQGRDHSRLERGF